MQLQAVIVPPSDVVDDALEASRELLPSTAASGAPPQGLLGRLIGRRQTAAAAAAGVTSVPIAPEAMFVRLAKIGNVEAADAAAFAKALGLAARSWQAPVLHVSKVSVAQAEPFEVTAELDGDLDALMSIFRNVNEVARLQRIFLDRRSYRSEFPLGSLRVEDGATFPADLMGAEVARQGPSWSPSHITLLRTSFSGGQTNFSEFARFELVHQVAGVRASA